MPDAFWWALGLLADIPPRRPAKPIVHSWRSPELAAAETRPSRWRDFWPLYLTGAKRWLRLTPAGRYVGAVYYGPSVEPRRAAPEPRRVQVDPVKRRG